MRSWRAQSGDEATMTLLHMTPPPPMYNSESIISRGACGTRKTQDLKHTSWRKVGKLDWNNLGGHEPARFRVVGQVLDAPERLREVVEALS